MNKSIHRQPQDESKCRSGAEILSKIFKIIGWIFERLIYVLVWLVKVIGTVIAGVFYGLAIGVVLLLKELYRFARWAKPYIKMFLVRYFLPAAEKFLAFLILTIKYLIIFLGQWIYYFFQAILHLLKNHFIPWVRFKFIPWAKVKAPIVAQAAAVAARYLALAVFIFIKGVYLLISLILKIFWQAVSILAGWLKEFFGPKAQRLYNHRGEIKDNLKSKWIEYKLFIFWLLKPITRIIPDKYEKGFLPPAGQLKLAFQPAINYADFRQLIREPRHSLLRKMMASWLIFFFIFSTLGITSLTPLFDWLFGPTEYTYAAPFTGAVRVSKENTTLSTAGGWLKAMAFSGDGVNGDGDYFQPIHPGTRSTTEGAAGTLAVGEIAMPTVTANAYDSAGASFIPWRPAADGNFYGLTIGVVNINTVVANLNVVVELLRFPSAVYSGGWTNYVACSAVNTCTYPADTVIERAQVMRFDQSISGETTYPGQYGIHYMDFRFDPPLAVTTASHYGFRVYYNSRTDIASWPRNGTTKPLVNAINFGLGIVNIDTAVASTVTIPLAQTTANYANSESTMVALNTAPAVGQAPAARTQNEHWRGTYSAADGTWTIVGSVSGTQTAKLTTATTGGTGASWVNDGVTKTTLSANATASTRLCVASITGFAVNQYIDIWDSQTASIQRTISSVNASDANCSNGPSIIVTATLAATDAFTVAKNATVARATWKLRLIQGAEETMTQYLSTTKFCVADASAFSVPGATYNNINLWDNNSAIGANRITAITIDDAACTTYPGDDSITVATTIAAYSTAQNAHVAEISTNFSNIGTPADGNIFRFASLNMGQNPTKTGSGNSFLLLYGKTAAPATSAVNYPWLANLRHPFYIAYGDADTAAPTDGDMVIVGGGASDPDTNDSTNLSDDLIMGSLSPHTVSVDKNFDMPMAYTGATGGGVGNGLTTAATASYGGSGFVSMLITTRAKLGVSNTANQRYRLVAPGKILLSSGAALELGSSSASLPRTTTVDLYLDSSGPAASSNLTIDSAAVTYIDVASTAGFYIGDVVMIKDNNSVPITRIIAAVTSSTRLTFTAAMVVGYTVAQSATVSRGPGTDVPTGADRRSFIYSSRVQAARVNMYSQGADNYRTATSSLAVDIDGNIDTGYLGAQQTVAGNTWADVSGQLAGDWSALDPISVAQGNSYAVNNWDSTLGLGANDDASVFPTWTGLATLGLNADAVYNPEQTEIGTIPLTNIYNYDYGGGSPAFSANYATSSAWTIFNDGANTEVDDAVYFGDQGNTPIYALEFNIGTAISASAARVWEYWNGSGWTEFTPVFGWKYVVRGTNNYGLGEYCIPFSASPTFPTAIVQLTDTNTLFALGQFVKIKDDDSPTIIRRILAVTAGAPANITFTEVIPSGYTTGANAKVCIPNGGQWQPMAPTELFTQTGRTMIAWNSWDMPSAAKTTVNDVNAYWVRSRISSFTSWTTSPVNQTTPVSMQGVETTNSTSLTVSNSVNEAKLNHLTVGASFDPNETWVLRYNDNSTAAATLKTTRWYESQTASWGTAHRWSSPNPDGETSAYYEKNVAEAAATNWRTLNGGFGWADYNVTSKIYMNYTPDATARRIGIFLRQNADDYGYAVYVSRTAATSLQFWTIAAGAETAITGTAAPTFNANTWYCLKTQVSTSGANNLLKAKLWAPVSEDADCNGDANEPGSWTLEVTHTPATAIAYLYSAGRFGLACDTNLCRFDDVTVENIAETETLFNDNFNDTSCWRVIGSIHGDQGCAYNSIPYSNGYIGFTLKHKGGVQSGETGVNAVVGPLNMPEQGDEIYLSPLMRGSNIGLDETEGITTSDTYSKYENWNFVYNSGSANWTVTGSQYGSADTATPGSTYTSPGGEISLKIKSGAPAGPKFGSRAVYFQNSFQRGVGNFTGLNNQSSAIIIQPTWVVAGSATGYNIEGAGGVADQKGTLDFQFKPNFSGSPPYLQYLFDYAANSNAERLSVRINPNGSLEFVVWAASAIATIVSTPFSPTAGQWYHFRGAWEDSGGALNKAYAFLDGTPFITNQGTTVGARTANAGYIRLGNSWQYNAGFDGAIDELAIFDDALDTSAGDNWGSFTPPTSAWTGGQTAGTALNIGTNIFLAHFDSAFERQKGTMFADYFVGYPVMVFTNGVDTITNDRIRVTTYPQMTRLWTDNTGSQYTPAARIKYSEGYNIGTAPGTEIGWMTGFQYHHLAASDNSTYPITSPVLNLRKQIRLWSDEDIATLNNTAPINQSYGVLLYWPKAMDVNHLELSQLYYGFYLSGNPYSTTLPYSTQYIRKSAFNNVQYYNIYTLNKTLGSQIIDNNNFSACAYSYYPFREDSSANITFSNNYVTGYTANYFTYWNTGRIFTISGNKFLNSYYPVWLMAGTAKVTLSNNQFWRFRRGLTLNGNSFVIMSGNSFDGGVSSEATNGYYGTGIHVVDGTTNVEVSDSNSYFGRSIWNEADVNLPPNATSYLAGSLLRYTGENSSFNSNFQYLGLSTQDKFGGEYLTTAIPGVDVRMGSGKDIVNYTNFGLMRTTGAGLTDTIVRTAGGYGWRMESTSKTDALDYAAKVVGVSGKPLAITGYLRINDDYGTVNLPTVTLSGLGMTGPNLTWTAAVTTNTWQQFVVSGTPTESALATLTFTIKSEPTLADSGTAENVDDAQGINLPTIIEDTDKSWTQNQWTGYKMRDDQGFIFDIISNTATRLFLKGTRIPFSNTLPSQPYGGAYEIFSPPYVYLDDISVLSGTVDTGTLDFHTAGQPVLPFLNTGLTAEAVWSAQYSSFADITGTFGQLLNDRLAIKRGLVNDAAATTIAFVTDLTETTSNFYQNQILVMMSGQNSGLSRRISAYNGSTKTITVDPALLFAPALNDEFVILSQYVSSSGGGGATAEEIWNYATRRLTDATLSGGGALATSAEITALQADVTYIRNVVDDIYTDTQYISGIVDDILAKWGAYDAADIITDLDTVKTRIGQYTDASDANTLFGRTKYLQEKWGTQTAQTIYDKADDAYDKIVEVQSELGYDGQSTTAYDDLQDVLGYVDQIEGYVDTLEGYVGLPSDLSTADTLFGRIKKNYEAIQALNNITAQQVWEYGTKELTGGVTLSDPTQVWDVATSFLTTVGSIGKLIVDNLDVAVSTRGTSDLTAADVWSEATRTITGITDPGLAAIAAEIWTDASRTLTSDDVTAQRVWDTLLSAITTTNSIGLLLKTDIDATVSSRASSAELAQTETNLTAEINANEAKIDSLISNLIVAESSVNDITPTVTEFDTNLTNANDNFYNDGVLLFTSGLNSGQVRRIYDYAGAGKTITVDPALTIAPANSDTFTILAQSAVASLDASTIWNYATRRLTDAQLDSGSLTTLANLTATESSLTSQITQTQKVIAGKIINQDTSVKTGNSLTILFRADSGLTGNDRPLINVWDPDGDPVVTNQYMTELGSTGVYKYALTFESGWGTGQFTVQSSEDASNTKDSINISVAAIDIAAIGTTIDLLSQDLISIRSTVTDDIIPTVTTFSTNLTSAVNDFYNNALITFTSGANAGVARRIDDYNGATKALTVEPALSVAPADGDGFTILKQLAVPVTQIAAIKTTVDAIDTKVDAIDAKIDTIINTLNTIDANLDSVQVTVNELRVSQQKDYKVALSNTAQVQTGQTYRAKLTVENFESEPTDAATDPTITIYDATREVIINSAEMNKLSAGVYEYTTSISASDTTGLWEAVVNVDVGGTSEIIRNDYFQVIGSPAQVVINSMTDLTVPSIAADVTLTNEGNSDFEYQYEWCVVSSEDNQCGGGNDVYYASAAKLIQTGGSFNTSLTATVPQAGNYWFKVVVYYGVESSGASRTFTAAIETEEEEKAAPTSSGGTSSGGTSTLCDNCSNKIYSEVFNASRQLNVILKMLGIMDPAMQNLLRVNLSNMESLTDIQNKIADLKAVTAVQKQIVQKKVLEPVVNTWYTSGSVVLNILITNPSDTTQEVPVKVYLPKEAKTEHIMNTDGLQIEYDVQLDNLYMVGKYRLGPKESVTKKIELRDIWQIPEEDLALMNSQSDNLFKQLEKTQFSAQALLLKNDLETRVDKIVRTQKENTATPQDKIMTYRENKESLAAAQKSLDEIKNLVTQAAVSKGFLGAFGGIQTISIWGIIIAFVTGFGLLVMILFTMWRHQMQVASGQLALQAQVLSGGKLSRKTIAEIFADKTIGPEEKAILKKHLSEKEIAKMAKKLYVTFFNFFKGLWKKIGKRVIAVFIAVVLVAILGYAAPRLIKNLPDIGRSAKNFLGGWWGIKNEIEKESNQESSRPVLEPGIIPPVSPAATSTPPEKITEEPIFISIKKTPTSRLNVRKEPSKTTEIIAKVNSGEKFKVIGLAEKKGEEKFGWYNIVLPDGLNGWVYEEYVQVSKE